MSEILVVKLGGTTIAEQAHVLADVAAVARRRPVVLVHGGGKRITEWLERLGVPSRFEGGLRVTDQQSLEVAAAVLRGVVNSELVAGLRDLGVDAVGLVVAGAGEDGPVLGDDRGRPDAGPAEPLVGEQLHDRPAADEAQVPDDGPAGGIEAGLDGGRPDTHPDPRTAEDDDDRPAGVRGHAGSQPRQLLPELGVAEGGEVPPGAREGFLDGVLPLLRVAQDQSRQRIEAGDRGACEVGPM